MSKEERIQEIVSAKLGGRAQMRDGELVIMGANYQLLCDMWKLLVAAETKLEPQAVAETIERPDMRVWLRDTMKDWGAPLSPSEIEIVCCHFENSFVHSPAPEPYREAIDGIRRAMGLSEHYYDTPAKVADAVRTRILYWLEKSQDSSAPDTKGLETALEQSLALLKECDAALVSHHEMGFVSRFVKSGTCEICSKGIFWKLPKVKSEAESALTSYREKRK